MILLCARGSIISKTVTQSNNLYFTQTHLTELGCHALKVLLPQEHDRLLAPFCCSEPFTGASTPLIWRCCNHGSFWQRHWDLQ